MRVQLYETRKSVVVYMSILLLSVILMELHLEGFIGSIWLALLISLPTFGYIFYHGSRIGSSFLYYRVFRRYFGWSKDDYATSCFGLMMPLFIFIMGYGLGVYLAVSNILLLKIITFMMVVFIIDRICDVV